MKKTAFAILAVLCVWMPQAWAAEETSETKPDPLDAASKSLMDESFVVETSDGDATDSLNRISGKIDNGFAPEGSTYQSVHHGRSGPFANSEAHDAGTAY